MLKLSDMARRTKWKGWIDPKDVDPEVLEKIRRHNERYEHYLKTLPQPPAGNNIWSAHWKAMEEVPLTKGEQEIRKRIDPSIEY